MARVQIILPEMPRELQTRLLEDAAERGVSRNDVLVAILGERYGVDVGEPVAKYRELEATDGPVTFQVPPKIRSKLRIEAARKSATMSGLVRVAVAEHYELPAGTPARKPRTVPVP